ncbi:hypothetical protein [Saccharomonospora piscinae]|uniref:hypothetical protein n=1 Tax=Saccharomonospora piscinae TaxID=687388 RepID=UPI00111BFB7D|nr:hypothetical protein [Saccharomonospora piscinae]
MSVVFSGVVRALPVCGHADPVDAQQGAVADDERLTSGELDRSASPMCRNASASMFSARLDTDIPGGGEGTSKLLAATELI